MWSMGAPRNNEYWRIVEIDGESRLSATQKVDTVKARNYKASKLWTEGKLRDHTERCAKGLLSYYAYDNDQLRTFIDDRRLPILSYARHNMLAALESADDEPVFHAFERLPSEIRCRVYTMYFEDFDQPLRSPKQPPLTLASNLLRVEGLPLFYRTCTFEVCTFRSRPTHTRRFYSAHSAPLANSIAPDSLAWINSLTDSWISDIKKIKIVLATRPHDPSISGETCSFHHGQPQLSMQVRLSTGKQRLVFTTFGECGCAGMWKHFEAGDAKNNPRLQGYFAQSRMVTDNIESRAGKVEFVKEDLFRLRETLDDIGL